jgi:hypothetical protein
MSHAARAHICAGSERAVEGSLAVAEATLGERWVNSGLMALAGDAEQPSLAGAGLLHAFDAFAGSVAVWSERIGRRVSVRESVLSERARLMGLRGQGRVSPNGACRLVRARNGWIAVNLPRPDDVSAVAAWLEAGAADDHWALIEAVCARRRAETLLERAAWLGLAVTRVPSGSRRRRLAFPTAEASDRRGRRLRPLVIDLSALWAGPLAGQILCRAGAEVIKVESISRPDTIRDSCPEFFRRLNDGKREMRLDFRSPVDLDRLRRLIAEADVVLSSARARALEALGLAPDAMTRNNPGLIWVAITGHGLRGPGALRIGFGDDCAAGAGLLIHDARNEPMFLADAVADPLAGLRAAALALEALTHHEGRVVDASLSDAAELAARTSDLNRPLPGALVRQQGQWHYRTASSSHSPMPLVRIGDVPPSFLDD